MRRIRVLVVLVAVACTVLGGASASTVSARGAVVGARTAGSIHSTVMGKRWGGHQ